MLPDRSPCGMKQNVYFVVDNSCNCDRQKNGLNNGFSDGCSVWTSARSMKVPYIYWRSHSVHWVLRGLLFSLMRQNVVIGPGFSKWTHNNCESINHSLKQSIEWQPQQLPKVIDPSAVTSAEGAITVPTTPLGRKETAQGETQSKRAFTNCLKIENGL